MARNRRPGKGFRQRQFLGEAVCAVVYLFDLSSCQSDFQEHSLGQCVQLCGLTWCLSYARSARDYHHRNVVLGKLTQPLELALGNKFSLFVMNSPSHLG